MGLLIVVHAVGVRAARAQTPEAAPRFAMDVVVTPERGETPRGVVAASSVSIDAAALARVPALDVGEALAGASGFIVARGPFSSGRPVVSARGFFGGGEAEYVTLLVDGVRIGNVESGLVDWSAVATSSIRKIEALRGPGASLYGDSAIGGVIQVFRDRPNGARLTTTAGSFGTVTTDATWGTRASSTAVVFSAAARRSGGAFGHAAANQITGEGSADGAFRGFGWRWTGGGRRHERDDPGALSRDVFLREPRSSDPLFRLDTRAERHLSTAFVLRHAMSAWRPVMRVYFEDRVEDGVRTVLLAPALGDRQARGVSTRAAGGTLEGEHVLAMPRPVTLRVGFEGARERLDTFYQPVTPAGARQAIGASVNGHRVRFGGFVFGAWEPGARVRFSAALRRDHVDDTAFSADAAARQRAWSPRAGVTVQVNEARTIALYGQVSRAFKMPTLDQLFDPRPFPDFRGGTFTLSNEHLAPQRAVNVETGISGTGPIRWSALVYRTAVDDEIDFDVRTFSYANIGRSRHTGLELEAAGAWKQVRLSLAYAQARVARVNDDRQLKNVPRHRFTVGVDLDLPWAVSAHARLARAQGMFLDDEHLFRADTPMTLDLRFRRPVGRSAVFVDGFNLLDDRYEEFGFALADFAGRPVPFVYPGAPRSARIGLALSF
jgi:outer membrane cobalamin receptor